jgi:hypothetical protein
MLSAQELAIPFDNEGKIFSLTNEQNYKLKLYQGDGTFKAAALYAINDSSYILEIIFEKNGKTFRSRLNMNNNELVALRTKVENELQASLKAVVNQEGRSWMLAATASAGISMYAPSLPTALNLSSSSFMGVYMLTASSGFFLPYFYTKDEPVTYAQANLVYYGLSRGYLHGFLLSASLTSSGNDRVMLGTAFCIGITESLLGYNFAKHNNIGNGTANLMTIYGDFGLLGGLAIANQLDLINGNGRGFAATVLLSGITGIGVGYGLNKDNTISAGDGEIIRTTAYLGAYLPIGFFIEMESGNPKFLSTTMLITGAAGAYAGHLFVRNHEFEFMHGAIIELGTVAGGLGGAGIGYIINNNSSSLITLAGAAGGIVSFAAMYKYYANNSLISRSSSTINLNFYPQNYFALKNPNIQPQYLSNFPLVSFSKRF